MSSLKACSILSIHILCQVFHFQAHTHMYTVIFSLKWLWAPMKSFRIVFPHIIYFLWAAESFSHASCSGCGELRENRTRLKNPKVSLVTGVSCAQRLWSLAPTQGLGVPGKRDFLALANPQECFGNCVFVYVFFPPPFPPPLHLSFTPSSSSSKCPR